MKSIFTHICRIAIRGTEADVPDGQLLERFLADGDAASFEALLRRHGPMVLGVCQRVLCHPQDAEDAFQATFLILVQHARSIVARDNVGSWLFGVAYRTAKKARAMGRRWAKEKQMPRFEGLPPRFEGSSAGTQPELRDLIDQELSQLPEKYRQPVVLCELEGMTHQEAARHLGWPVGTVSGRLSRARVLLGKRLERHGLVFSGGSIALALGMAEGNLLASVPQPLFASTVQVATLVAGGQAAVMSAPVAALTKAMSKMMLLTKLKFVGACVLLTGSLVAAWSVCQSYAGVSTSHPSVASSSAAALAKHRTAHHADPKAENNKPTENKPNDEPILPFGVAPIQVLAQFQDGKIVISSTRPIFRVVPSSARALVEAPGTGKENSAPNGLRTVTFEVQEVTAMDTRGKRLGENELAKILKEQSVIMVSLNGQPVDPLHLRVLKEGMIVLVLPKPIPAPRAANGSDR